MSTYHNTHIAHCRQTSLRRIARWVTQLVGHVDLTPSDVVLALTLVATLQRKRRRYDIIMLNTAQSESSLLDTVML